MIYPATTSLIPRFRYLARLQFRGIALAVMASALLLMAATPSKALTYSWSFVTTGDSDNPGETVSGLIWGLQEGFNNGSDVHASVTSTPTGELLGGGWEFVTTMPPFGMAFEVTGGVLTYANAGFKRGDHELLFSLNDVSGYSSPKLDDQEDIWWYAGFDDTTAFTPKAYYELNLQVPWMLMATALDPASPNYSEDPAYRNFLAAAYANEASMSVAAAPEVPIPAALPLLAAGLGAMGFAGWRKKRKAISAT